MTPPPSSIARPRLIRLLSARWKVAVLSAPAGYGKSTLAAQFAGRRSTLWCRLREEDRDAAHLLGTLLAAGLRLRSPVGRRTFALFETRRDMERDGGLLTSSLLDELRPDRSERFIVLDDLHVIAEARASLRWIRALIEDSDPRVRFLLTCRGECPVPLARFEMLGGVTVLRAEDLEFTVEEQTRLLHRGFRLRLDPSEEAALREELGGWAAGLVLAAQRLRGAASAALPAAPALEGADRLAGLLGFLAEEVIATLPEDLQKDLCRVSLLEDLDRESVAALLGAARSDALLHEIARRDLFVRTLPDGAGTARFHPLLRDHLRRRLAIEVGEAGRGRLLARLARHWLRRGRPERAIRALADAGRPEEAVGLFESVASAADPARARESLRPIAADLLARGAGSARFSPWLCLHAAYQARDLGRLDEADVRAREASRLFSDRRLHDQAARAFAMDANLSIMRGRLHETLLEADRLLARLPRSSRAARGLVLLHQGNLRLHAGEPAPARALLEQGLRLLRGCGHAVEEADAAVWRASVEFTEGRWDVFLLWAGRALPIFRRGGYAGRAETLLINMAEACTYLGDEEKALAYLDEAGALNARSGIRQNRTYKALGRARALSEKGVFEEAARLFERAREAAAAFGPPIAIHQADLWEGVLERRRGRLARARELLDAAASAFTRLESPAWATLACMERGLVVGLQGRADEALRELRASARSSRRFGDRKELARNALYEARVLQASGRPFAAALKRALRGLAEGDHLVTLRKEADLAVPLVSQWAAAGAGRPDALFERIVAAMPAAVRARVEAPAPGRRAAARRATAPPCVRIRMLGGFDLSVNGKAVTLPRQAAKAMIAYLALHAGRLVRREALAETLWPGAGAASSRNRFDVTLSAARRALEPDAAARGPFRIIVAEGGMCRLARGVVRSDLEEFEEAAKACRPILEALSRGAGGARSMTDPREARSAIARVRSAVAAYGGELLPGFAPSPWADAERERVRDRAHRLMIALGTLALALGRHDEALEAARRVLADDPLSEEAVRVLLRALAAQGDRAMMLRSYRRFARRLIRELGTAPSPETRALAREIAAGA